MMQATYKVNVGDGETVEMSGDPDKLDRIVQAMKKHGPGESEKNLRVDTTALYQGIIDGVATKDISAEYAERIHEAIKVIAYAGPVGRMVCDYGALLIALADIEATWWFEVSLLWKHYLGASLASGIAVAANCGRRGHGG